MESRMRGAGGSLYAGPLLRCFARRTLDPDAAAELTAETFAEAFASRAASGISASTT